MIKIKKVYNCRRTIIGGFDMSGADKIFALMDANPVYLNGQKWSREELYER